MFFSVKITFLGVETHTHLKSGKLGVQIHALIY